MTASFASLLENMEKNSTPARVTGTSIDALNEGPTVNNREGGQTRQYAPYHVEINDTDESVDAEVESISTERRRVEQATAPSSFQNVNYTVDRESGCPPYSRGRGFTPHRNLGSRDQRRVHFQIPENEHVIDEERFSNPQPPNSQISTAQQYQAPPISTPVNHLIRVIIQIPLPDGRMS